MTVYLPYGKRAFCFIRPDAAAEVLTENQRHLRGHIKLPTASEVMLTRGSKTIGQSGLWRLSFAPISSQEFYALERA